MISKRISTSINKIFRVFLSVMLLFQSLGPALLFSPAVVFAQDETNPSTPTPTETLTPTPAVTITPEVTPEPTATTTPPPTPVLQETGDLTTFVAQNVEADSVNLDAIDPENVEQTAKLATDKADYAPTDTAIITGTGFIAGQTYILKIFSTDSPPVIHEVEVTADENGQFVYAYQLDGTVRPNYTVTAKNPISGEVLAETTFTDSINISCTPNPITLGNSTSCKATGLGNNPVDHMSWYDASNNRQFYEPCTSNGTCTITQSPNSTGTWTVNLIQDSNSGILATTTFSVTSSTPTPTPTPTDSTAPTGGSITYTNGYLTTASVALTVDDGTDASGIDTSSRIVERDSAALSGGVCGSFGSFSTISPIGTYPNLTDSTVLNGNCYQYRYKVSDNATPANQAVYTSANIAEIDTEDPTVSATGNSNSWQNSVPTITVSAADTISGVAVVKYAWDAPASTGTATTDGANLASTWPSDGEHTLNLYVQDNAGLTNTWSGLYKIDTTAPVISKIITGTLGSNSWYTSNVTVAWTVTDPEFTPVIDSGCGTQPFTSETTGTTSSCSAHSAGGSSSDSVNLKIDKTGPSAALAVTAGTAGSNGWYTSDATVSTSGTDSISSPVTCTADQSQTTETKGQIFNGSCTNNAGLTTNAAPLTVKLDKTGPSANLSVTVGTAGLNGWYTSDVTVSTSGTDTISSPVTCTADQQQTTETAGIDFSGSCTNDAGLSIDADDLTVKLDKTGPTANLAVTTGTLGAHGWYTSDVTVSTSGSDDISGPVSCTADQYQTAEAAGQIFNGKCTNYAGLETAATPLTVKLDKTGPSAALAVTAGTLGSNGWYTSDVTVHTSGTDAISDSVTCTTDQQQTTETAGQIFNGQCVNGAGLSTDADPLTIKLDKNAPATTLTIGSPNSGGDPTYVSLATEFTLDATDSYSTVDYKEYKFDDGSWATYSSAFTAPGLGSYTLYYRAADKAGNIEDGQTKDIVVGATSLKLLKVPVPSGTIPNQYSDPATVSATLVDLATNLPISGKTISFTIEAQTATATTGTDGVASTTITLTQPSGPYTVSVSFAGDTNYQSSSDSKSFTINKENVAITYNGDAFVITAGPTITTAPVRLSATLSQEDDGYPGELTKAKITFELTPAGGGSTIPVTNIPVSAAGDALTTTNVPVGDYAVQVIISTGNLYWIQQPEGIGTLHVEAGSNDQRVTGGGWIPDVLSANSKDNFGFTVNYNKNGAPKGNFLFMFRNATDGYDYQLKSNSWAKGGLSFTSTNIAFFTTKATLSQIDRATGQVISSDGNYTFIVNIQDLDFNVKPVKTPDTFAITIFGSNNNIWKQVGTAASPISLGGGNVVIHSK
jgi:hypothetical protein